MQFFYNQGKGDMDSLEIHELNQEEGEENVQIRNNVDVSGSSKKRSDEMKRNKEYFVELPVEESYGKGEDEIINCLLNELSRPDPKRVDMWQPPRALEWDPVSQAPFKNSQGTMISILYELKLSQEK